MGRTRSVADSVVIDRSPSELYGMIGDVTRMGEWSPENKGATRRREGAAEVGDEFIGSNTRGRVSWSTLCTVTRAEPGRVFAFRVHEIGGPKRRLPARIASWQYTFEDHDGGTLVTETWTDDRPWPDVVARVFDSAVTGGRTFADFQRGNIRRTLRKLKVVAEADVVR
ncbi:SRPBCC family protein [Arthrobacter echini]|uniref:SRPBCC family protein n=1 Tax=Arthrobacter echini TaxID=1529066 RepID=A0A4S5E8N9_9MICC|nr:SRPBCC family protein [Arthrobacter echini]THJ67964.1 SRPBCC family protein [Arthrobacter echini]